MNNDIVDIHDAGLGAVVIEHTEDFGEYTISTFTDNFGNTSIFDSREDYVVENGGIIHYDVTETEEIVDLNSQIVPMVSLPAWQRIRRLDTTVAFEKAIRDLVVSTILGAIKIWFGVAYGIAQAIRDGHQKPDLYNTRSFYVRRDTYGKTFSYNTTGTHRYALDARWRKVSRTDQFTNQELRRFLGY